MIDFLHENLRALIAAEKSVDSELRIADLDEAWFATFFTRLLTMEAWNAIPGADGGGPTTRHVLISSEPELVRLLGIDDALEKPGLSPARTKELTALREEAAQKVLLAAFTLAADSDGLRRAASRTRPVLREIYDWVASHIRDEPLGAAPEVSTAILARLGLEGVYALKVAAAADPSRELGELPVLSGTARLLEARGLLEPSTFKDVVVRLRSHALPSFQKLIDLLVSHGMTNHEVDASKGASTNPLTMAGIGRSALKTHSAQGDGWRSPEAQTRRLRRQVERSFAEARRTHQPLLVLGEGYASARAMHEAAAKYSDVRAGFVAFTQSGLNFLKALRKLRFSVDSFADASLKKLAESRPLGEWIVERELDLRREEGSPPPQKLAAAVVGYGESVGPGIARALRGKGFGRIIVVDSNPSRLDRAKEDGFEDVVAARRDGSLPAADLYFTAAGQPNIIGEAALRSMPTGATVVIHGSSVESDRHFIHRARTRKIAGVRARALEKHLLPDHRTLEIAFSDTKKKVRLRKMGQPFFDGRKDKDRLLVDVYMSGILAALAVAAKRLKKGDPEAARIQTLDAEIQRDIGALVEASYGIDPMKPSEGGLHRAG
jgi:hypothetical protein